MFERLSDGFTQVFRKLSGKGAITDANVREAMVDVRKALLDADVNLAVVDKFCADVVTDALGTQVTKSLKPGEEMIGIVYHRLVELLGGQADLTGTVPAPTDSAVLRVSPGPTIVMMCGLQGSGKTTTCGKLAGYLKKRGRSVMLAAADLQRPAAVEQLQIVAEQVERELPGGATVSFYAEPDKVAEYGKAVGVAVQVCQRALAKARAAGVDTLILDTAGRLHIDDALMGELTQVNKALNPHQVFLVVDAMTGQDAVNSAKAFHEKLEIDGVILTKFDSDTRGGAAISVKAVTGAPIRFVGIGEKLDALEEFHAQRIAGRILGMGDVLSLVEKAQEQVSIEDAERMQAKLARGEMTMDDFLMQLKSLRKMGSMKSLLGMIPGFNSLVKDVNIEDKQLDQVEAIINSMTRQEKTNPDVLNNSRRRRIAKGSGTNEHAVSQLAKQFTALSKMTKQMAGMSTFTKMKAVKALGSGDIGSLMEGMGGGAPAMPGMKPAGGFKDRFKKRKR
jgi:signal recognition particle subunit SRP54